MRIANKYLWQNVYYRLFQVKRCPELEAIKLHVKPCWYGTAHGELVIMQGDTKPGRRQPNDPWFVPEYVAYRTTFYSKLQLPL